MLRSFRVTNHRSLRDEQELLLMPAYDKDRLVVPVAATYGANASGKSNLLDAMRFMQLAVRESYAAWEPGGGVPRKPFRLDAALEAAPSLYAVELVLDGVRYAYGFEIDDETVQAEWLYSYPRNRRRVVFERSGEKIRLGSTQTDQRAGRALKELTRPSALFLSMAARVELHDVLPVYEWFRIGLTAPTLRVTNWRSLAERLVSDAPRRETILELVRTADLGIIDIQIEPEDEDAGLLASDLARLADFRAEAHHRASELHRRAAEAGGRMRTSLERQLREAQANVELAEHQLMRAQSAYERQRRRGPTLIFVQGKHRSLLGIGEQSDGTRAWLSLLSTALTALDRGQVLLVDEVDTSLHPRLTARLIELFQDERTNLHNAQLILTTHDATLLGTSFGREVLHRDQIWFVEKDGDGATNLFPLTDFHPRKGENTERRYLGGSYGAVPRVFSDSLVESYLASRSELTDAAP